MNVQDGLRRGNTVRTQGMGLGVALMVAAAGLALPTQVARAQDNPVILQWFETRWADMERRMPDFFSAGYGALWLPPVTRGYVDPTIGNQNSSSAGYDPFDRFSLGRPGAETAYGTETSFRRVIDEFKKANALVYIDSVMNHNAGRQGSATFQSWGGYPGFWMAPATPPVNKTSTSNWGDFHAGNASGFLQSENPNGANYDLYRGDLVALIDIDQGTNHQFIRNPVEAGNPQNIPAGTYFNRPDPTNRRTYPDRDLPKRTINNPGVPGRSGPITLDFWPYNTANPQAGDPVTDNATGYLLRWTQWMLQEFKIDGYRIDAIKHVPSWFWDQFWDSVVHLQRQTPDGRWVTPYSFGESVEGQTFTINNFVRKDSFANRDALDLNGSGALRDLLNNPASATWQNVLNTHIDAFDNGFNDGSVGVNHVFSHDNGTTGDGNSAPAYPTIRQQGWAQNAYVLMRSGPVKIYHNSRGVTRTGGFWPRQGIPVALGVDYNTNAANPVITNLVQLHNFFARGEFNVINASDTSNPGLQDVIVFERRKNLGGGNYSANVLVGVNKRWDSGFDQRNVQTSFPSGMRLFEYTGNAQSAAIDPTNNIVDVLTVDSNRRVTIATPRNVTGTSEHGRGFVVYAPAIPGGTLSFTPTASTIAPDSSAIPAQRRRSSSIPVITANTFNIVLNTTNGDPQGIDNASDDNALFRVNAGYTDWGTGFIGWSASLPQSVVGYSNFQNRSPRVGGGTGTYSQPIDATRLSEGMNYISVISFRQRNSNEDPIFREWRQAVYIDRLAPQVTVRDPGTLTTSSATFWVDSSDRTVSRVHLMLNPSGDPVTMSNFLNQAAAFDRFTWNRTIGGMQHGWNTITAVAFEDSGRSSVVSRDFFVDLCVADFDKSGFTDADDFIAYVEAFELGCTGAGDPDPACLRNADVDGSGFVDSDDFIFFVNRFNAGC